MFAICIESSHSKGMGHLFRMLSFAKYLDKIKQNYIFIINDNKQTKSILEQNNIKYEIADLNEYDSNWESVIIKKYTIMYWINDRLETDIKHANNVKGNGTKLITFDDLGTGAEVSDINICGLFFNNQNIPGSRVLKGTDFLILNDEIDIYKRERKKVENVFVTLGGSDTYGVTIKVLKLLKKYNIKATIHIGPSFNNNKELQRELNSDYKVINKTPSLIKEFSKYDLAITGGGLTPFEANASGLPCLVIASEIFEIPNGEFLSRIGSSEFLGFYEDINDKLLSNLHILDIQNMSKAGMENFNTKAVSKIYNEINKI